MALFGTRCATGCGSSRSLHPDKTRLIEFGRFAAQNCQRRGLAKPETFTFLGFVLVCGKSRRGDFQLRRKSRRDRMCTNLREIKEALRQRMHRPLPETGKWLAQIVAGYFAYHAVPTNRAAIAAFHYHVVVLWYRQLCRRSQRADWSGRRWRNWPMSSFPSRVSCTRGRGCASPSGTRGRSRVPELGPLGSVRGALSNERPYRELARSAGRVGLGTGAKRFLDRSVPCGIVEHLIARFRVLS
jgi:hypothetical protein